MTLLMVAEYIGNDISLIDNRLLFFFIPIQTTTFYWLFLYTNRYVSAKRKRQFYQHKAMIARHIPVMIEHYQQTKETEFVQKLHFSLYELPQYEHRTKLRLKVKDWVHAELEEHYKHKRKDEKDDKASDNNKE